MNKFDCFEISVELIEKLKDGSGSGHNLHSLIVADSPAQAIEYAVAHARNRKAALGWEIGAVSACLNAVLRPDKNGYIGLARSVDFFEWKCDFPGTLDEYAEDAIEKLATKSSDPSPKKPPPHVMFGRVCAGDMDALTVGVELQRWPEQSVRIGEAVAVVPINRSCQCYDTDNCPVCAENVRVVAETMKKAGEPDVE